MSLITRCPTCETMFRVVPDQLRVSEGWVRCGQCAEVFDATQNMVPPLGAPADGPAAIPPKPAPPAPPASAATTATTRTVPALRAPPAPTPAAAALPPPAAGATGPWTPTRSGPSSSSDMSSAGEQTVANRAPSHRDDAPRAPAHAAAERDWPDATQSDIEPSDDLNADSIDTPTPAERDFPPTAPPNPDGDVNPVSSKPFLGDVSPLPAFLQDAPPPSIWKRPLVRLALAVLLLLLLALLAMQFLVKERDRVAALHPVLHPVLEVFCAMADCRIEPLRQIESIVIDSSSFSRVRGDDYRLGFSLKNTAPIAVAMPAIELSLTDPQDQPVIRRVILPTELGARSAALASAAIWTGSLALTVHPDIGAQRIAGYRLLAFYP